MKIIYTSPLNSALIEVTGTAAELAPIVLQLVETGTISKPVPTTSNATKYRSFKHSSHPQYKKMRLDVVNDFKSGMTLDEIASKYPVTRNTLTKWIRESRTPQRATASKKSSPKTIVTDLRQQIESITLR